MTKTLMVLGTASEVGKSLIVTPLFSEHEMAFRLVGRRFSVLPCAPARRIDGYSWRSGRF